MYKRNYKLQSPKRGKKKALSAWGTADRGARALMTRAELVDELAVMNVDEPTLTCCHCCSPRIKSCARRRLPLFRPLRVTSLFWTEKALVVLDALQLYGLVWSLALPWPWPTMWRRWTAWITAFNLDSLSLNHNAYLDTPLTTSVFVPRSMRGELDGFLWAWLGWLIAALAIPVAYWTLRRTLHATSADWQQFRSHAWNGAVLLNMVMYLPIQLWLARAFACEQNTGEPVSRLSVDAGLECGGVEHVVMCVLSSLCMAAMVGWAVYLIRMVRSNIVYPRAGLHERHLRWKEAEYLHFINHEWLTSGFWVWSSFSRPNACYRPARMLFKTACVLVFSLMHFNTPAQASSMLLLFTGWAVWETLFPAFRCHSCGSTRAMSLCFNWVLVLDMLLGAMRAYNVSNPLMVDTNFTITMAIVNGLTFVVLVGVVVTAAFKRHIHWPAPSLATSTARSARRGDPFRYSAVDGRKRDINSVLPPAAISETQREDEFEVTSELQWVSAILRANAEVSQAQMGAPELVDPSLLDASAQQLRAMWREARAMKHVLSWSLLDTMDELAALADACRRRSYLPNAALSRLIPPLVKRLKHRAERLALVTPHKRRILIKLLAFRSWIGDRVFERIEMGGTNPRMDSIRYNLNPFSVIREPPSVGAVGVMTASDLLRDMPSILRARPTGHPKVMARVPARSFEQSAKLMRAVQNRWAELLLDYERSFTVDSGHLRHRLRDSTEVAAWFSAARQINAIVASIDSVDPLMGRSSTGMYAAPRGPVADTREFGEG